MPTVRHQGRALIDAFIKYTVIGKIRNFQQTIRYILEMVQDSDCVTITGSRMWNHTISGDLEDHFRYRITRQGQYLEK